MRPFVLLWAVLGSLCTLAASASRDVLVVGSVNMDIIAEVQRLPLKGETTLSSAPSVSLAVGGKGANQAVAAARLGSRGRQVRFVCRFGNDSFAATLQAQLAAAGVDVGGCVTVPHLGSGQGIVLLEPDGAASSVVVGGANTAWEQGEGFTHLMPGVGVVLLQREVPEHVNLAVARAAAAAGVLVLLDAGGEARPLPDALLPLLAYLSPNELELASLTGATDTSTRELVVTAARSLTQQGVGAVLVTLAERGAVLVGADGSVLHQAAFPVPGGIAVDGTAAGDAFRAAFAVGLVEGWPLQHCLQFAAAAGALAASQKGALPSLPHLADVAAHLRAHAGQADAALLSALDAMLDSILGQRDGSEADCSPSDAASCPAPAAAAAAAAAGERAAPAPMLPCPQHFASRLNSMQARWDLVEAEQRLEGRGGPARVLSDGVPAEVRDDVQGWIWRLGRVQGLTHVDLNHPQHFERVTQAEIQAAITKAGLAVGAINVRFPPKFRAGAFTNPDPVLRAAAVALAAEGCARAAALGAPHLVVWSPYDGYDHHLQVDYDAAWQYTVDAYRQLCTACPPGVTVSLEFKPTDAASRFSIVPTTAAALLLVQEVGAPNLALALDIGHLLLAGENPAQSIALAARAKKLAVLHLNDAHVRLGAEDGLPFGSANPTMALEVVRQLQRSAWGGHLYFDTFPAEMDPEAEAAWNVEQFQALWSTAARLAPALDDLAVRQDGLGVLRLLLQEQQTCLRGHGRHTRM